MKDHEKAFTKRMNQLMTEGVSFKKVSRQAMNETLGETTSVVVAITLGRDAFSDPEKFVKGLNRIFGGDLQALLRTIEERAESTLDVCLVEQDSGSVATLLSSLAETISVRERAG